MGRNDSQGFFRRGKKQLIMNSKTLFPLHNRWSYRMRILLLVLMLGLLCAGNSYGIGKDKKVEQYEKSVKDLFVDDRWEEGMKILREGLRLYPESSELNGLAGSYYYQLKDYDNARYFLVRAVKDTPDNVNAKSLLVNVEEETGNYSSAICYVNELLEVTPYWPGLWKRKIGLYRRQGNNIEADRLLKRLVQIYPNDTTIRQDYLDRLEENYLRERKAGDKVAAIEALQELLANDKSQEVYYLDLTNLLLQQGSPESALQVASEYKGKQKPTIETLKDEFIVGHLMGGPSRKEILKQQPKINILWDYHTHNAILLTEAQRQRTYSNDSIEIFEGKKEFFFGFPFKLVTHKDMTLMKDKFEVIGKLKIKENFNRSGGYDYLSNLERFEDILNDIDRHMEIFRNVKFPIKLLCEIN